MSVQEELKECDDLTLALVFALQLHNVYNSCGHSMDSLGPWLLDPILSLSLERGTQKFRTPPKEVEAEIRRRVTLQRPLQLRLFNDLEYLSDEEYFCLLIGCLQNTRGDHTEEPSVYETAEVIALALRARERFSESEFTAYSSKQLIDEGRKRYFRCAT